MSSYEEFLRSKQSTANLSGFDPVLPMNPLMKPFQAAVCAWSLRLGRSAIFGGTGTGKTVIELEWARHVCHKTNGKVLILAPLSVAHQTVREGEKFGIGVHYCRSQAETKEGINITNYEMIDRFDPLSFAGIVPDEASILKSYMGKIKQKLILFASHIPYRLAATATPAPNDHLELGNHADFLGIMKSNEMISRYFVNDTMRAGNYRLKNHSREAFWRWICTWAACYDKPSDLGFDDDTGYILPPLNMMEHIVDVNATKNADEGYLLRTASLTAISLARENRLTLDDRVAKAAEIVNAGAETWCIWCELNSEADQLRRSIPGSVEVRGSEPIDKKERKLNDFSDGKTRVLISKPKICGFGMNWQHCHNTMFVGINYKYEPMFQAIRRFWRFGQDHPVNVHVIMAETEGPVMKALKRKQADHEAMKVEMIRTMREFGSLDAIKRNLRLTPYVPGQPIRLPSWLHGDTPGERPDERENAWFSVSEEGANSWSKALMTPRQETTAAFLNTPRGLNGKRRENR